MKNDVKNAPLRATPGIGEPYRGWAIFFLGTIAVLGFPLVYCTVIPLSLVGRVSRRAWRLGGLWMSWMVRLLLRLQPWSKISITGYEFPRERAFLTVSNHRSHLDMFLLLSRIPNIRPIAKAELFHVPFLAVMLRVLKVIRVQTGSIRSYLTAMETAIRSLVRDGDPVHIFPEATRSPEGAPGTLPFQLAPFRMAMVAKVPIVPVVFTGTDGAWPKGRFSIRYQVPMRLHALDPVNVLEFTSAAELRDEVRRRIDLELSRNGS